jgi:hypothetical protein
MYELNVQQTGEIGGGWVIAVLALAVAVIAAADELEDFGKGFKDGFKEGYKNK